MPLYNKFRVIKRSTVRVHGKSEVMLFYVIQINLYFMNNVLTFKKLLKLNFGAVL